MVPGFPSQCWGSTGAEELPWIFGHTLAPSLQADPTGGSCISSLLEAFFLSPWYHASLLVPHRAGSGGQAMLFHPRSGQDLGLERPSMGAALVHRFIPSLVKALWESENTVATFPPKCTYTHFW